jgi:small subunit ribosomal protein S4
MGDPKFPRRKWEGPRHPWEADRIAAENELLKKYGLKNKRELWRAESLLRRFRQRSRILQAQIRYGSAQAEREKEELLGRLERMGLLAPDGTLNDVLGMEVEAILSRRLQTMAYVKGLAHTPRHARQLIVHGHMAIGGRKVNIPGYIVTRAEEEQITYTPSSPLAHDLHPARPAVEAPVPPPPVPTTEEE